MPKVPTPSAASSSRPSLRRNQACLSCRKRKLKCDAGRPHCSTCFKQWQTQISVPPPPGYTHPTEPQCSYDPVEGLPLAPDIDPSEKIRELEEQVAALTRKLKGKKATLDSPEGSPSPANHNSPHLRPSSASLSPSSSYTAAYSPDRPSTGGPIALPHASLAEVNAMSVDRLVNDPSPELNFLHSGRTEPLKALIQTGWNPDLPDPASLERYVEVFFKCDPCSSRILHRPSFMASLLLPPRSPDFPHAAILHAICASASRWLSKDVIVLPDGTRRDRFAEFHSRKTREYIDRTMASGADIFQVMQACILLSWYFYFEGRWVEVWIFAGFQARVAVPLRLNYQGTLATNNTGSPGAYLAPPKDHTDLELRRRAWWMTVMFDRIVSVGGWVHALDEKDIGTELPLRGIDFELGHLVADSPQHLWTPSLYTEHPSGYTDSFVLFLKAMMLFGRVTDFNVRTDLRTQTSNKIQNPFRLPGFEELDRLVCDEFLENLPPKFKNAFGNEDTSVYSNGGLDTDLYMAHLVPHAAAITLHNSYIDLKNDPTGTSPKRCIDASRAILNQHYALTATSYDTTRLHPFATICWYLAAVVQIQLCKYYIERGETDKEYQIWGEINILRFAMTNYGQRSPIGTRQEKILQGLMTEIVRMTTQQQPLKVGIPLYAFSHERVFAKDPSLEDADADLAHLAPLPVDAGLGEQHPLGASPNALSPNVPMGSPSLLGPSPGHSIISPIGHGGTGMITPPILPSIASHNLSPQLAQGRSAEAAAAWAMADLSRTSYK